MGTIRRLRALLLSLLLLTTSWLAGEDRDAKADGIWIDVCAGEPLGYEEVLKDLATADVIYLGERHTLQRHHAIQTRIVTDLAQRGVSLALGLEQMESSRQPHLDRYHRGEINFEQLAEATGWPTRWRNYQQYRPVLEAARQRKIPVVALNARAETIRQVVRSGGFERLPRDARQDLPADMQLRDPDYEKVLSLQMMVHAAATPAALRPMSEAQSARDEAMAQALAAFLTSEPGRGRKAVVLCGVGHVAYGLGLPSRVLRRLPGTSDRIVLLSESGEVQLSPEERAQARDIEITHQQLREIQRPVADYLCVKPLGEKPADPTGGRDAVGSKPNVIVILTDDQGFGELGATGNLLIRTPHIDRLAAQSASLVNFHVMPVCSPTRACLMTGRYHYRTGVTDTFLGRSLMHPDEPTLAEIFAAGGYRTGIFGKWHLGDNYPMRAMDRGFQESLVLNGGGLAQPGDPPDPVDERGAYFNATLRHNGAWVKTKGYVSDVITEAAIRFIQQQSDRPFFVYLPFNCPHSPHQVPDEYRQRYQGKDFSASAFPKKGHPASAKNDPDVLARVYGMIENIDDNVGRLLAKLDELKLAENTIVVFLSDNGCQRHNGYNAGFQGWKGTPLEGGIHQFCFIRWPAHLQAGRQVDRIAAHIDLAPTLLDLCGVPKPARVKFDGVSLAPLLRGQQAAWPDRVLFFQWHRGDAPERYRAFAARSQDWKLVQPLGAGEKWSGQTDFQLYDMAHDPLELHNLAAREPDRVAKLKAAYDAWFDDVTGGRDYTVPPRIFLGAPQENPVLLTRQDWRGSGASWGPKGVGYWEVKVVARAGYEIKLRFDPLKTEGEATLSCGGVSARQAIPAGPDQCVFKCVELPVGPARLEANILEGQAVLGVRYVEVKRID